MLDRWIEHGVRPVSAADDGAGGEGAGEEVTLTTSKHQETFTYIRPSWPAYDAAGARLVRPDAAPDLDPSPQGHPTFPFYRPEGPSTMARLPSLRPAALYVVGVRSAMAAPDICRDRVARTGRVREVRHPDRGHLIPMEDPRFCAAHAADWATAVLDQWWAEERRFDDWARRPPADKVTVGDDFRRHLGIAHAPRAEPASKL